MPKVVDAKARRAEFVAASLKVIASEGLGGATLKRVAGEAGCTTGALTHYYSDRGALLIDALRGAHHAAAARMLSAARGPADPAERLRQVLLEALPLDAARLGEWKVWLAFWGATTGEPALAAENARRYGQWRSFLQALTAPLCKDRAAAASETALLIALVDGLGLQIALFAGPAEGLQTLQRGAAEALAHYAARFEGRRP